MLHEDCFHFRGDRPCRPHKLYGVHCEGCPLYLPVARRALIVKFAAMGDVLRTTVMLRPLSREGLVHVTWITAPECAPLLENNPWVHRILTDPVSILGTVEGECFDLAFFLEADEKVAKLAARVKASLKKGFGWHEKGYPFPLDEDADTWYRMGLFDDIKRANRETFGEILLKLCGLPVEKGEPLYFPRQEELDDARHVLEELAPPGAGPLIGLNTGAGERWLYKKWTFEGYLELGKSLLARGFRVVLLGGPEEEERHHRLTRAVPGLLSAGCRHPLRRFAALVAHCDAVVTGDTLALHLAQALRKKVVAIFGPTSPWEAETYGRTEVVVPDLPCIGCYLPSCYRRPYCMELVRPDEVSEALERLLAVPAYGGG